MTDATRIVRGTLTFALLLSVLANVGHTLLADSAVPVWMRMIGAVAWPLLVFLGVDITVKVAWELIQGKRGAVVLARGLILLPGVPAAITSYEHMHAVLLAMDEKPFIAAIGPGAVDFMMIGCTITLVLMKRPAREVAAANLERGAIADLLAPEPRTTVEPATLEQVSLADIKRWGDEGVATPARGRKPRAPRPAGGSAILAVQMLLEGKPGEAVEQGLMGASTMRRYSRALDLARAGKVIDCKKEHVRPDMVELIKAHVEAATIRTAMTS